MKRAAPKRLKELTAEKVVFYLRKLVEKGLVVARRTSSGDVEVFQVDGRKFINGLSEAQHASLGKLRARGAHILTRSGGTIFWLDPKEAAKGGYIATALDAVVVHQTEALKDLIRDLLLDPRLQEVSE